MTSAWSQLEQMLTCAICLDKFKNPRLLPCQHSFCGDACMEGLVDYARRQIKCPECRAEHRIPYQGVSSLPSNVTLIRFLELHSRITGEEPEPVPTFMEKCSICGEKIDGVQRCWHCEKKVCPECKEAHIDLLKREINRVNNQSKRCLTKLQEFKETLVKSQDRLIINHTTIRHEIEESCKRLIEDLQSKQKRLVEEVDLFKESEEKTIEKLKVAINDELSILESNIKLADDKISNKYPWNDQELSELKEVYVRAMEFVRLFDPDIGDFTRKIRFNLIPEFEQLKRRLCEVGELKFSETASSLIASSLSYCNATGNVALELCNSAAAQAAAAMAASSSGAPSGYGLSHSNSNTNLGIGSSMNQPTLLDIPGSMQNALMRSQSDHRLASQFQQRLKQQEAAASGSKNGNSRYGSSANRDYETDSIRSRYAPPRSSIGGAKDYSADLLTRDWPRPSDNDAGSDVSFGSSIHFKSAFMRRKEKERQQLGSYGGYNNDEDDDLVSEASYGGGAGGRNVRFYSDNQANADQASGRQMMVSKLFDCKEVERAPLSGLPKLDASPYLLTRLHQMGAKAIVDKKHAEEEGQRDKDLMESARMAMSKANENRMKAKRQQSEDEIEKQKRENQEQQQQAQTIGRNNDPTENVSARFRSQEREARETPPRHSPSSTVDLNSSASTVVEVDTSRPSTPPPASTTTSQLTVAASVSATSDPSTAVGGRRSLYGQAVTEKSKRQLSDAIQDAVNYTSTRSRRNNAASSSNDGEQTPEVSTASNGSSGSGRPRRGLRSAGRSMSKQTSLDQGSGSELSSPGTGSAISRRRRLLRGESSQQSADSPTTPNTTSGETKNLASGSGGYSESGKQSSSVSTRQDSLATEQQPARRPYYTRTSTADQTSTTTDDDDDDVNSATKLRDDALKRKSATPTQTSDHTVSPSSRYGRTETADSSNSDNNDDDAGNGDEEYRGGRNAGNRRSREMLPNAVNKLLDRSAQIRRDSQEQRSRGDSPQREQRPSMRSAQTGATQSSFYSTRPSSNQTTNYSSSPGASSTSSYSAAARHRLAYQRSKSIRDDDDDDHATTNSNNSVYTTASSSSRRKSSLEDDFNGRKSSGNSTDRTLTDYNSRSPYLRRDSSTDSPTATSGYQSRFLARSRTSAALASTGSSNRSQDLNDSAATTDVLDSSSSSRSYMSSRDRFMQSPSVASGTNPGAGSSTTAAATSTSPTGGSNLYSSGSRSGSASAGSKSHSEYLRNKFNRRTSSNSSASSALLKSRSSHAVYSRDSNNDDDDDQDDGHDNNPDNENDDVNDDGSFGRNFSSHKTKRRNSTLNSGSFESQSSASFAPRSVYSSKREMLFKIGSRGSDPGNFTWPRGVTVGTGARVREIVVADSSNHRVQVFDCNGKFLNEFGSYGSAEGEFDCLAGVAINRSSKNYIVSDRYNHRIQVFDFSGNFVRSFGEFGRDQGKFNLPWGVACDSSGLVYVCDKENHRIQVFAVDGTYLSKFGTCGTQSGQLQHPHYIAVGRGKIVVTDTNNHRVQIFDLSGRMLQTLGNEGSQNGQFKFPRGIAMDEQGMIVVGDSGNNRLQIFNSDGTFVKSIGSWGSADGEFKGIEGVAVDSSNNILVCDRENHRIQVF